MVNPSKVVMTHATHAIRHTVLSVRDLLVTAGPFVVLALVLLVVAYWLLDPTPPRARKPQHYKQFEANPSLS